MNQKIYINKKQNEEQRVILVENNKLVGYEQEFSGQENKKGNIYKGVVTRVQDSLNAAFVDYGDDKNGFLPLKEIPADSPGVTADGLQVGDSLLVQIKKDHVGDKGAGLTGYISLPGCYLVLQPNRNNRVMMSKRIDRDTRGRMQQVIGSLDLPDHMSVILRTAGLNRSEEDLQWDLQSYLLKLWDAIESAAKEQQTPALIYHEHNLLLRVVRDYFRPGKTELVCDSLDAYEEVRSFVALMFPDHLSDVHYHDSNSDMIPPSIENQIDLIFEREVATPSGIRVIFDSTEALVAVDVNSGRLNSGDNIEETALAANMEAADIIALHLRLRNLGGLIVVDFIDMENEKNRRSLESHFNLLLKRDRARTNSTSISQFGLMEISRQRISRSLAALQENVCERCSGTGRAWRPASFALRLLRKLRSIAANPETEALLIQAPSDTAIYLLNEKRIEIRRIEEDCNCDILIAPNENLYPPNYRIRHLKANAPMEDSHKIVQAQKEQQFEQLQSNYDETRKPAGMSKPLIKTVLPETSAPKSPAATPTPTPTPQTIGLMKKFLSLFTGEESNDNGKADAKPPTPDAQTKRRNPPRRTSANNSPRNANRNRGGGRQRPRGEEGRGGGRNRTNTPPPRRDAQTAGATNADKPIDKADKPVDKAERKPRAPAGANNDAPTANADNNRQPPNRTKHDSSAVPPPSKAVEQTAMNKPAETAPPPSKAVEQTAMNKPAETAPPPKQMQSDWFDMEDGNKAPVKKPPQTATATPAAVKPPPTPATKPPQTATATPPPTPATKPPQTAAATETSPAAKPPQVATTTPAAKPPQTPPTPSLQRVETVEETQQ